MRMRGLWLAACAAGAAAQSNSCRAVEGCRYYNIDCSCGVCEAGRVRQGACPGGELPDAEGFPWWGVLLCCVGGLLCVGLVAFAVVKMRNANAAKQSAQHGGGDVREEEQPMVPGGPNPEHAWDGGKEVGPGVVDNNHDSNDINNDNSYAHPTRVASGAVDTRPSASERDAAGAPPPQVHPAHLSTQPQNYKTPSHVSCPPASRSPSAWGVDLPKQRGRPQPAYDPHPQHGSASHLPMEFNSVPTSPSCPPSRVAPVSYASRQTITDRNSQAAAVPTGSGGDASHTSIPAALRVSMNGGGSGSAFEMPSVVVQSPSRESSIMPPHSAPPHSPTNALSHTAPQSHASTADTPNYKRSRPPQMQPFQMEGTPRSQPQPQPHPTSPSRPPSQAPRSRAAVSSPIAPPSRVPSKPVVCNPPSMMTCNPPSQLSGTQPNSRIAPLSTGPSQHPSEPFQSNI